MHSRGLISQTSEKRDRSPRTCSSPAAPLSTQIDTCTESPGPRATEDNSTRSASRGGTQRGPEGGQGQWGSSPSAGRVHRLPQPLCIHTPATEKAVVRRAKEPSSTQSRTALPNSAHVVAASRGCSEPRSVRPSRLGKGLGAAGSQRRQAGKHGRARGLAPTAQHA